MLLPVTDAVNCWVLPVWTAADDGETATAIAGGVVVTATDADADLVVSATLVAVTV